MHHPVLINFVEFHSERLTLTWYFKWALRCRIYPCNRLFHSYICTFFNLFCKL